MTFCATVNAIIHAGATPVLADIDPVTWNISVADLERKVTPRTKALMLVHFAGRACDMDPILAIARNHGLKVIEDCAHAIETEYKGRGAGLFGDLGVFSFYSTKSLVTGEGGMVLSSDEALNRRIKCLGLHGMSRDAWQRFSDKGYKHYYVEEAGFKYNMMDLQAAIGIHQLKRIEDYSEIRKSVWAKYMQAFEDLPVTLPSAPEPSTRHAYHLFQIQLTDDVLLTRDEFLEKMTERKIGLGVHYLAIPEHPYYQRTFGWNPKDFPNATRFGRRTVSLPLSAKLTEKDVEDVITSVREVLLAPAW
jgi:dTDP-4-amino-4,6-dideoxygalactose transaminase